MEPSGSRSFMLLILLLVLLASTVDGRNDPGEYWREIMKDQPMPEEIKGLVYSGLSGYKETNDGQAAEKSFIKDFDPRPNLSTYNDDVHPNQVKAADKDCSTHHDGPASKKPFKDDFEPRPNLSAYNE